MNVFLIGYRGTGKSTVARLAAQRLGRTWLDADVEIERRAKKTIAEIFVDCGEAGFRELESQLIQELVGNMADLQGPIVALGGGAVLRAGNREALRGRGTVIWLLASPQTIATRIQADPDTARMRPNLTAAGGVDEIAQLLDQRTPIYRECADHMIDTEGKTVEQIAIQVSAIAQEE